MLGFLTASFSGRGAPKLFSETGVRRDSGGCHHHHLQLFVLIITSLTQRRRPPHGSNVETRSKKRRCSVAPGARSRRKRRRRWYAARRRPPGACHSRATHPHQFAINCIVCTRQASAARVDVRVGVCMPCATCNGDRPVPVLMDFHRIYTCVLPVPTRYGALCIHSCHIHNSLARHMHGMLHERFGQLRNKTFDSLQPARTFVGSFSRERLGAVTAPSRS